MANQCLSDCSLIIQTFEKAAHSDMSETSVYATLPSIVEQVKNFSNMVQQTLSSYIPAPVSDGSTGSLGERPVVDEGFGEKLLDYAKDCIPCADRILSSMELFPSIDLLAAFELDLQSKISLLDDVVGLLKNFDVYGDLCKLLDLLGFMCIPDLQKLIAILSSLISFDVPKLNLSTDIVINLVAPLFTPLLSSISTLLDQFALIVLSPIDCILNYLDTEVSKLRIETRNTTIEAGIEPEAQENLVNGLTELRDGIIEGRDTIVEKLDFYISQIQELLGEFNSKSKFNVELSVKKLHRLRLIMLMVSIIKAINKGTLSCSNKSIEQSQMEEFINNFLNPNVEYSLRLDPEGQLVIDDRVGGGVVDIGGEDLITPEYQNINDQIKNLEGSIQEKTKITIPCKMKAEAGKADKINKWIKDLYKG